MCVTGVLHIGKLSKEELEDREVKDLVQLKACGGGKAGFRGCKVNSTQSGKVQLSSTQVDVQSIDIGKHLRQSLILALSRHANNNGYRYNQFQSIW